MKSPLRRCVMASLHRFYGLPVHTFCTFAFLLGAFFFTAATNAQSPLPDLSATHSVSGQFIITGGNSFSPLAHSPAAATNAELVRLDPAILSVTAERIKQSLWHELGIPSDAPWQGKVFLALHPARTFDEDVIIASQPFGKNWDYEIQLPDVLPQGRLARALDSALLLEFANRHAQSHPAEIPAWLVDGLAQQLLADDAPELILSSPEKTVDGFAQSRLVQHERGLDPLAGARRVLKNFPALTFEQMNWPDDAQINGNDGGAYLASVQVFSSALLGLPNGPAHLRAMLENLPACYNWQTAFQNAFRENFPRPLDLEKWWAVQVVSFAARDPGPAWTPEVSREKLDEILSVPVAIRSDSNALPERAEISLQAVIRNFDPPQRVSILQTKLRDLELTELRLAAPLIGLADGYRLVLAGYLGEHSELPKLHSDRAESASRKLNTQEALKKLDQLDAWRRAQDAAIKPDVLKP